jgi:hypothetical protein
MQGAVLVDGFVRAMWRPNAAAGTTTLLITPFVKSIPSADRAAITDEARALLEFLAPGGKHDVRFGPPRP